MVATAARRCSRAASAVSAEFSWARRESTVCRSRPPHRPHGYDRAYGSISVAVVNLIEMTEQLPVELRQRDPEFIRAVLPPLWLATTVWFRAEVHGFEHVPDEPVLFVGNHSGGGATPDTFVFLLPTTPSSPWKADRCTRLPTTPSQPHRVWAN